MLSAKISDIQSSPELRSKMEAFPLLLTLSLSAMVVCTNTTIPVHFWLFTINNLEEYENMVFDGSSITLAPDTLFDVMKPTKVVVHGWGGETHIDEIFASAYAEAGLDYNIIGVDWRDMEGPAQEQVVEVGVYTAHFLQALVADFSLLLEDVHPIGWSYGAHVVGRLSHDFHLVL